MPISLQSYACRTCGSILSPIAKQRLDSDTAPELMDLQSVLQWCYCGKLLSAAVLPISCGSASLLQHETEIKCWQRVNLFFLGFAASGERIYSEFKGSGAQISVVVWVSRNSFFLSWLLWLRFRKIVIYLAGIHRLSDVWRQRIRCRFILVGL